VNNYLGQRYIELSKKGRFTYGGWGKGVGLNVELSQETDHFNFYFQQLIPDQTIAFKIQLQEDDNENNKYEKEYDDAWIYTVMLGSEHGDAGTSWQLISIPLNKFKDENSGGDGKFNIGYKNGKLLCMIISFADSLKTGIKTGVPSTNQNWAFDFFCFSKGKLPTGNTQTEPPAVSSDNYCSLGAWSKEGITEDFIDIASSFEKTFKQGSDKKLGVIHFFHPFAVDGGTSLNNFPEVSGINKIIRKGYIPMITLEDHFVNVRPRVKQPNLYSIVEGHFDAFLKQWAKEIKKVDGIVLLRILHEFNGDWYPWCIAKNNNDPVLLVKAFQHIHNIFKEQQVTNVKFIWCPNSTSFPQEKWNYIMDAYPGDEFVDYVGLDIYNGAGQEAPVWRSFRKEGIENYFTLTQHFPDKPLLVCEVASRERKKNEPQASQNKAEWIRQMSDALKTDMSKVKLLSWFNEKELFKITSSSEAKNAYLNYILNDDYFKSGTNYLNFPP
jgi:beta-mannanase